MSSPQQRVSVDEAREVLGELQVESTYSGWDQKTETEH